MIFNPARSQWLYSPLLAGLLVLSLPFSAAQADNVELSVQASPEVEKSWSEKTQEVLFKALSLSGIRYRYGGSSPDTGFDCSGFVRYVFQQAASLSLPHGARSISQMGEFVSKEDLQPGDLVFFNTLRSAFSHVGIYIGDNRFIHAPSSGGGVKIVDMNERYWVNSYNGARRIEHDK
ncbi:C40 family peptidase [Methylobacillus flagellatus]|uniref:C40 family peptidase n=1 Tax=Methylobacillus flagellatus TaxID=405 RepID=UPI0010F864C7|nr:C40 family peptidase [Methylobacillus flagellatus]